MTTWRDVERGARLAVTGLLSLPFTLLALGAFLTGLALALAAVCVAAIVVAPAIALGKLGGWDQFQGKTP